MTTHPLSSPLLTSSLLLSYIICFPHYVRIHLFLLTRISLLFSHILFLLTYLSLFYSFLYTQKMGNLCGSPSGASTKHVTNKGKAPFKPPPPIISSNPSTTSQKNVIDKKGHQPEDEVLSQDDLRAQELRRKADQHAKQRGEYYEQSQNAFKSGDKARAKELSDKGKREQALMEEANNQVSSTLQPSSCSPCHLLRLPLLSFSL